ncbi:hypothetical protein C0993_009543 [Termitomyces sp. T159_Od127]|nr:hypothetical protein C0993_009543 [Termitomyces sp. T159_Od127]
MDDEEAELRNPFPSPPSHYTKYSSHNLRLLALLRERAPDQPDANQHQVLSDQSDVPDWSLTQLEKPRVDWILEEPDAYYDVFGDRWFVKEKIPSLAETGGNQLYPADPSTGKVFFKYGYYDSPYMLMRPSPCTSEHSTFSARHILVFDFVSPRAPS